MPVFFNSKKPADEREVTSAPAGGDQAPVSAPIATPSAPQGKLMSKFKTKRLSFVRRTLGALLSASLQAIGLAADLNSFH